MKILKDNYSAFDNKKLSVFEICNEHSHEEENIILIEGYQNLKDSQKRKMRLLNKHLLLMDSPKEGIFQLPKVLPYKGEIPEIFIPYSAKVCCNSGAKGIYCHIDDRGFNVTWTHPIHALRKVKKYRTAVTPDNTLWVDGAVCENIEQLRRSRTIQRFWQNNGVDTIQTASWGNAESIRTYAFDGLAEDSWTAIGHQRIGNRCEQRLFKYGVSALVDKKKPYGLIVFGAPLDFDPGVPVIYKPSFISKLRKL